MKNETKVVSKKQAIESESRESVDEDEEKDIDAATNYLAKDKLKEP